MIGENDKFIFFNLPPTSYKKVSYKMPQNKLGEEAQKFTKVLRISWAIFCDGTPNNQFELLKSSEPLQPMNQKPMEPLNQLNRLNLCTN